MKKLLFFIFVLFICLSELFASISYGQSIVMDKQYKPVFVNRFNRLAYDLWENPAELGDNKFVFDFPEVGISFNNLSSVLTNDSCLDYYREKNYVSLLLQYFTFMGDGRNATNELLKLDFGGGSQLGGFAFRIDGQFDMNTLNKRGYASLASIGIMPEIDVALSLGYGAKILDTDLFSLMAGASIHPSVRVFTEEISAKDVADKVDDLTELLKSDLFLAISAPVDLSVSAGFINDQIKVYSKANNIFGSYKYVSGSYDKIASNFSDSLSSEDKFDAGHFGLDLGCNINPSLKGFEPYTFVEISDVVDFFENLPDDRKLAGKDIIKHFNFGVGFEAFNIVQLGFEYKDGYRQLIAGVGFNDVKVQAYYGAKEYNNNVSDTLTLVVKLGWDKN